MLCPAALGYFAQVSVATSAAKVYDRPLFDLLSVDSSDGDCDDGVWQHCVLLTLTQPHLFDRGSALATRANTI